MHLERPLSPASSRDTDHAPSHDGARLVDLLSIVSASVPHIPI